MVVDKAEELEVFEIYSFKKFFKAFKFVARVMLTRSAALKMAEEGGGWVEENVIYVRSLVTRR